MSLARGAPLLHIQHATLCTSIGDDLLTTVAAFASRRKHFRHVEIDRQKVVTAPARDITGTLRGEARLLALLMAAWAPMAQQLATFAPAPSVYLLALPEWVKHADKQASGGSDLDSPLKRIVQAFNRHCTDLKLQPQPVHAFTGGAETCHAAHEHALRLLARDPALQRVIVLAANSLCDPDVLLAEYRAGRIYGREQSSGWVPGEAAACVLMTPATHIRHLPEGRFALHPPCVSNAPEHTPRWPSDVEGDGVLLHQALDGALTHAAMRPQHLSHHVSNGDGSAWRLEDEDAATSRLVVQPDDRWSCASLQPAELLGQLGAAGVAVHWALVSGLHQADLSVINSVMCSTQDISGRCSANVMERSPYLAGSSHTQEAPKGRE